MLNGPMGLQSGIMGQLQQQLPPTNKAADVFDILRQCQKNYHEACLAFQQVQINRANAEKELASASAEANAQIQAALADPTVPQAVSASANGRY
jgi:hypothetical protein